jgi:hypothetical protein
VAILSPRIALAEDIAPAGSPEGQYRLLTHGDGLNGLAQVLGAIQTIVLDAGGNFAFNNLAPNTTFTLTIHTPDGHVLVREVVTTPGAGALRFLRSTNCLPTPLLPPPPPILLPPPPSPLMSVPGIIGAVQPDVPVIPEADSLLLLALGLLAVGVVSMQHVRRRSDEARQAGGRRGRRF